MRTSALIMICFLALLTITGCKKTGVNDVSENATIIYAGDPAADGDPAHHRGRAQPRHGEA